MTASQAKNWSRGATDAELQSAYANLKAKQQRMSQSALAKSLRVSDKLYLELTKRKLGMA